MSIANFVGKSSERKMGHYISATVLAIDTGGYVNNVTMILRSCLIGNSLMRKRYQTNNSNHDSNMYNDYLKSL